jgi:hypothetical protein
VAVLVSDVGLWRPSCHLVDDQEEHAPLLSGWLSIAHLFEVCRSNSSAGLHSPRRGVLRMHPQMVVTGELSGGYSRHEQFAWTHARPPCFLFLRDWRSREVAGSAST